MKSKMLCRIMDELLGRPAGSSEKLITFVTDRPGHDYRYSIDATKIRRELNWQPEVGFEEGLRRTAESMINDQ